MSLKTLPFSRIERKPIKAWSRPAKVMTVLTIITIGIIALFMTLEIKGNLGFVIPFRATKVLAMVLIGYAIALSTVLFQTITANRILTPSIMGFDALYGLLQTVLVFSLGTARLVNIDPLIRFVMELGLMISFSLILFRWLFGSKRQSLHLLILVGIIFGVLFRSLSSFLQRLIDPNEFATLQDIMFASFNSFDRELLGISAVIIIVASFIVLRMHHVYDTMSLGKEIAINLGVNYPRTISITLVIVTLLVSVSTALVGPVTFFGLLVANLAYQIIGSYKHLWIIPCAALLAVSFLISGQMIVERVFSFTTSLSLIVEFVGGIVFIYMLVRRISR